MTNGTCSHATAIRIIDAPLILTAGGMATPAPLGAAILSLAEGKRTPLLTGLPGYRPTQMRLAWQDMGVPALSPDDWQWLAERLAALPGKRLHVHCQMGHGRTGTALAILCSLWGAVPEGQDPVTWVRTMYCDRAVETQAQCDYVAKVTGRTVTAAPSQPAVVQSSILRDYTVGPEGLYERRTDPYASRDYFQTGVDDPPRSYGKSYRREDDSLGARRARAERTDRPDFSRHFPANSKPDRPGTESRIPAEKRPAGPSPKARYPVAYPQSPSTLNSVGPIAPPPGSTASLPAPEGEEGK